MYHKNRQNYICTTHFIKSNASIATNIALNYGINYNKIKSMSNLTQ